MQTFLYRLLLVLVLVALLSPPALGKGSWEPQPESADAEDELTDMERLTLLRKQRRDRYRVEPRVTRYLTRAAEVTDDGEPREAQKMLEGLDVARLNPHERALVYQLTAFIAYSAGDTRAAIDAFRKVIEQEVMSPTDENRIRFNIAQLHAGIQDWQGTIDSLQIWMDHTEEQDPLAYYLMAIAYFQLEKVDEAIPWAEKAVDEAPEPKESWLQLLAALYVGKEDYVRATPVLEELVFRFPKKAYWVQLSLIYGARDDYAHSLAIQQVAYMQGLLDEGEDLKRLARSYLYANLPYQAAKVLEKGLDEGKIEPDPEAYELLANSWIGAREYEKALGPLQKAAEISEGGDLYVRLGQVHLQRENWRTAAEMFQKALDKGGLKDAGNALLLLGISYYNDERVDRARAQFHKARRYDSSRPEAERWMKHIANEQKATG